MKKVLFFMLASFIALTACQKPTPVKTIENLKAGIIGETTASAKYEAFAAKAVEEGYDTIARLFMAASKSESIHAANHLKVLEELGVKMDPINPQFEVNTTAMNLQAAIEGEGYEVATMYPEFINAAKEEKVKKAVKSFTWAVDTEKKHQEFYKAALTALNNNTEKDLAYEFLVCPTCGNTYAKGNVDDKCAFCRTDSGEFIAI
jgi:rubrerythrin